MTPQEIESFFQADKSDWYIDLKNGSRVWKDGLVQKFWNLLKTERIDKGNYNFNHFIFPTFSKGGQAILNTKANYFINIIGSPKKKIEKDISFKNCIFLGDVFFLGAISNVVSDPDANIIIEKSLIFENCDFEKELRLQGQEIKGNLNVSNCEFKDSCNLMLSNYAGNISINNCNFNADFLCHGNEVNGSTNITGNKFQKQFQSGRNRFKGKFSINTAEINGKASIHSNNYKTHSVFAYIQLNDKSSFRHENYSTASFQEIEFSQKNHLFEELFIAEEKALKFRGIVFQASVTIRKTDCSKMIFLDSDLTELKFSSCNWNDKNRLITQNELEEKINENRYELKNLENLYRQLKRNFENHKNWELSGKAYVSEMYFRKQRLWQEKNYLSWFIYSFYDLFGGFTQDYIRPLKWLGFFTLIIFPSYYFIFECIEFKAIDNISLNCHWSENFVKSFAAALPWLKTDLVFYNWWIQALQNTISVILLTFFILALRKRFKQ